MKGKSSLEQAKRTLMGRLRLLSTRHPKASLTDLERDDPMDFIVLC